MQPRKSLTYPHPSYPRRLLSYWLDKVAMGPTEAWSHVHYMQGMKYKLEKLRVFDDLGGELKKEIRDSDDT